MTSTYYYPGSDDNGGVHTNSGVNNKAAYLMVDGGTFNGKTVTAVGADKTLAIYYEVQTNLLTSGADYADLYNALYQGCLNLVGGTSGIVSEDCQQVRNATDAVEMNKKPAFSGFYLDAQLCSDGLEPNYTFQDDLESGTSNWTIVNGGTTRWQYGSPYGTFAHSGTNFLFADDYPASIDDVHVKLKPITIPSNGYLHFSHAYDFETYSDDPNFYDGGVLEYSTNSGVTWVDAGSLMDTNGYSAIIFPNHNNPLKGRTAFAGISHGYTGTRLNLSSLAGKSVTFRWRMGLDDWGSRWGWWLDDVQIYQCAQARPHVVSIVRTNVNPTNTANVDFTVTFSDPVTGINESAPFRDFNLVTTGITGASITAVTGTGPTRTITINTGTGNGTIRLDLVDNDNIVDGTGKKLGGTGLGNGNFNSGETYTVDKIAPIVSSINRIDSSPTSASSVKFTVTFSESVSGVGTVTPFNDFVLTTSGVSGAAVSGISISGSGTTHTVTVNTGAESGAIRLDIPDTATITDLAGNPLGGLPYISGETYTINKPPRVAVLTTPIGNIGGDSTPTFQWNKLQDAAQYEVIAYKQALVKNKKTGKWVNTNVYMINQSFTQDQACKAGTLLCSVSAGPTVPFASGIYYWQVQASNAAGNSPWSDLITFTVELPGVNLISPENGAAGYIVTGDPATSTIPDYKPTFRWSKDSIATDYYLNVAGPNVYNTKTKKWVANTVVSKSVKSAAVCNAETNVCSWESPVSLGANTYSWSVTPKSPGGNGLAVSGTFNTSLIPPGEVSRTSPEDAASGYIEDAGGSREYAPEFKWTADPIATQYYVKVVGPPVYNSKLRKWVPNTVVSQWVMPEACVAGECSLQGPRLGGGAYSWSVQAYTPAGYGPLPVADPYGYFNISTTLPGEVTRISPDDAASGYIENAGGLPEYAPKFEWNADPIATDYYVNVVGPPVYNKKTRKWVPNTVVSRLVTREDACESGTCSLQGPRLGGGAYSWYVKAYTPAGYGPLPVVDPYGTFNINTTPPDGVDLIEPNGGTNGDYTPVFKWTKSLMATDYSVNVAGPPVYNSKTKKWVPNTVFAQWVTSEEACNEPDTCSLQGPTLPAMDYTWHVIPSSPAGLGPILEYGAFNPIAAVPDPVTLTAPVNGTLTGYIVEGDPATGTIPEYAPEYEWTAVSSATQYYVYVAGPPVYNSKTRKWVANPVVSKSVKSEDACVSGTCSLQGPALSAATYTWYVQAFNPSGGSTTTPGNFNTSTLLPPAVTDLIYPAPIPPDPMESLVNIGFDYNPTYQWERVEGATQYLVYIPGPPVYNKKTRKWVANPVLNKWFPADTYCDDTTCSVPKAQSPTLGGSTYTWQVRAYSPAGYTDWSPAVTFSPNAQTPPPAVSGMRVNGVPNDNPKDKPIFTWQKVNVATSYRVYVSGTNGVMLDTWVTSVNACPGNVCAVEMPATLAADKYNWWVQSYNVLGYGPWRKSTFSVLKAPAATTGLSPTGTTTDTRPDFSWAKVDNSSLYRLYVRGLNGTVVLDESYQASSICTGATCSITSPIDFDSGDYVWSVMTYNDAAGYGPWKSANLKITP
jgi:hypothetical protein